MEFPPGEPTAMTNRPCEPSGRRSKTVTSCPSRNNPRAIEMPPTPAPSTPQQPSPPAAAQTEPSPPQVEGDANFNAAVEFGGGPGRFLQRLLLKGDVSLERMRFTKPETQQAMDAFSARVRKDPSEDAKASGAAAPADPGGGGGDRS